MARNMNFEGQHTYRVTAIAEGNPDFTAVIKADNEWIARTRIMFLYPYPLGGRLVEYRVEVQS
jgi:hypothetical protein